MSTTLKTAGEQTMLYRYDQLNRIKTAVSTQNTYQTGYSYDANGNILSLLRNDHNNTTIDNLSYTYNTTQNNRLNKLRDNSNNNTGFTSSATPFSYQYDNIGNLIEDEEKEIGEITWTVYGKVQSVEKNDGTMISYKYDATGNRIYKKVNTTETHYVRDASGNLMATYENKIAKDFVIYGSSRLGVYNGNTQTGKRTLGNKKYELSNHLGNALSVISDNKIGVDSDTDLVADYYEPYIVSESDYYPYGMTMEKRSFASSEYRFGFNTQEKSTELGEDTYTAEFWQYDSKIARRWNNDPRPNTSISVYAAFAGNPIMFNDKKGDTLDINNHVISLMDIYSLVNSNSKPFVKIQRINGITNVSLDFGNTNSQQIQQLLNQDEGLNLLNDLVQSNKNFFYAASEVIKVRLPNGQRQSNPLVMDNNLISNTSDNGLDSNNKLTNLPMPKYKNLNYNGQVVIHPNGVFYESNGSGGQVVKPRRSLVFHELAESYERTHNGIDYNDRGFRSGAHSLAKSRERTWNQRSLTPGELQADANGQATNRQYLLKIFRTNPSTSSVILQEAKQYINEGKAPIRGERRGSGMGSMHLDKFEDIK